MSPIISQLLKVLESLGESSQFCCSGSIAPVLPGLELEAIGDVGVPISQADAKRLIERASQAPYGRGEETIVDTDVRRVWQLEPRQFSIHNSAWSGFIDGIVELVRKEFGIRKKVQHELYKMLIYEKGSFFSPHRDTEKIPGMFATLVVGLPCRHEGGTLIVTQDGETRRIDFGGAESSFNVQYAAFYADCRHEITAVTSGYRVCLVYNLAIPRQKEQPSAPLSSHAVDTIAELLPKFFADDLRDKIVIPFKHQYSEAALEPSELKGADRSTMDVLRRAAQRLGYQLFVALVTHHQSGTPNYDSIDYPRSRGRYRRFDGDWDDDISGDDEGADFEEVYEEERSLDGWRDGQGRKQPFGQVSFAEDEFISEIPEDDRPYKQEISEATGNEGATLDRWYRQAAVVIWPRERYFRILAREGPEHAVPALEELVAATADPSGDTACREAATEIINRWNETTSSWDSPAQRRSLGSRMLTLLDRIGASDLATRFVREILPANCDGKEGPILCQIASHSGWQPLAEPLKHFFGKQSPTDYSSKLAHSVNNFESLCCSAPAMTDERRSVCIALADELERVIRRWDRQPVEEWDEPDEEWDGPEDEEDAEWHGAESRAGIVQSVFRAFTALEEIDRLGQFIAYVLSKPKGYDLRTVLVPAVKVIQATLHADSPARNSFERLLHHCMAELRAWTATPVQPPADWTRDADLKCKCADCKELAKFLRSPTERVHRFPRRKELRAHLHSEIDRHRLDLTHVTDRRGSPQTLVCTKNQASYERRLTQFKVDLRLLEALEALAGSDTKRIKISSAPHRAKTKRVSSKRTP
jgi:hypothetical protein